MNKFKSYWEFEDKERACFTEEEVRRLLDAELMVNGVIRPEKPPPMLTVMDLDLPKRAFARVTFAAYGSEKSPVVFDTAEQAEAFLRLSPRVVVDDWETRTKYTRSIEGAQVATELFCEEGDVVAAKVELKRIVAKRNDIERARQEYEEKAKAVEKVTAKVWDDWHDVRAVAERMRKIQATYVEYLALTNVDAGLAMKFLCKAYDHATIKTAAEWLGDAALSAVSLIAPDAPPSIAQDPPLAPDDLPF